MDAWEGWQQDGVGCWLDGCRAVDAIALEDREDGRMEVDERRKKNEKPILCPFLLFSRAFAFAFALLLLLLCF